MRKERRENFGELKDGTKVFLYTLENEVGDKVSFTEYAAALVRWDVKQADGSFKNIVKGFSNAEDYVRAHGCYGAICGPYANRIENAEIRLNDQYFRIPKNEGDNVCHCGEAGFHFKKWEMSAFSKDEITFSLKLEDGDGGLPGNRLVEVTYSFDDDRNLTISYKAETDKDTIFNLTNHSYFNLLPGKDVREMQIEVNASFFTPVDEDLIPTGEILSVSGTAFDMRNLLPLANVLDTEDERIRRVGALDHNFVLDQEERGELKYAARILSEQSKDQLVCFTTESAIQVYTAPNKDKENTDLKHGEICLETQNFPNSPNCTHFPNPVVKAGEVYTSQTIYSYQAF